MNAMTNNVGAAGHNSDLSPEELNELAKLTMEIQDIEDKVSALNAGKNAKRKAIKAMRIDLDAWRAAKRRLEMDPDQRDHFDQSQATCNAALGVPIQGALFGDATGADSNPIPAGPLN